MSIIYVTGNYGKYISVKEQFNSKNIDISFFEYDFNEPEINDIELVSRAKAKEAYQVLGEPCFVADSGFYIDNYPNNPGYPGAFVKRSGISTDIDGLLWMVKDITDRSCSFIDCLTFYDGIEFYTFYGESKGVLSYEKKGDFLKKAMSNLWYVFIPQNCSKTLAEMSDCERVTRNDGHTSATSIFADWYKNEYCSKKMILKDKKTII